jgi:hypothetical protein
MTDDSKPAGDEKQQCGKQSSGGTAAIGIVGAILAGLAGLFRHADDVARPVARHADDFGRVASHGTDDFARVLPHHTRAESKAAERTSGALSHTKDAAEFFLKVDGNGQTGGKSNGDEKQQNGYRPNKRIR